MRIWVTRDEPPPPGGSLSAALQARGLTAVLEPVVQRRKIGNASNELKTLNSSDWIVLTSAFTVSCIDLSAAKGAHVAVVGQATADAARQARLQVDHVSANAGVDALFAELRKRVSSGTICYLRSSQAQIPLTWKNVRIVAPIIYDTVPIQFDRTISQRVDAAAITSPSAINAIGRFELPLASIGPTTSEAIRKLEMKVWVEAAEPSFESLAHAIANASIRSE